MRKSLAETVNFGEAVQQKGYEKRAQQVDTFVQSESAQQKLARSGKAQTAQAIQALSSMGSSIAEGMAKKRENEVKALTDDLAGITAQSLEEARLGNKPYDSETFIDLPVRFQVKIRNQVGQSAGARAINEANAGITDEMRLNPEALAEHLESFMPANEVTTGMGAHEKLGFDSAWNAGLDKINNGVIQAQAVEGQRKVNEQVVFGAATIMNNANEVLVQQQAETGKLPTATDMKLAATSTYTQLQTYFEQTGVVEGVKVPNSVRKALIRDEIIAQAKSTGNVYLLAPENIPKEYQDGTTLRAFADARISITEAREAEARQARSDDNAAWYEQTRQATDDAYEGKINRDTPNLTVIQFDAVVANELRKGTNELISNRNAIAFEDQIQVSVADPQQRGLLLDKAGDPVLDGAGNTVPLLKDALNTYVSSTTNINTQDAKRVQNAMDENLVGFDVSQHLSGAPLQNARTVLTNKKVMVDARMHGEFEVEMEDRFKEIYSSHFYQAKKTKGFSTPLNHQEREDVRTTAHSEFLTEVTARIDAGFTPAEIDLDGNEVGSTEEVKADKAAVYTPDPNQAAFEAMSPEKQAFFNAHKNNPKFMRDYIDAGNPLPNAEEEVQGAYDEIRATVDDDELDKMSDEDLEEMLFGVANYEYGDGFRSTAGMDRTKFGRLDVGTRKVLMDRFINTKANEFVSLLNGFYNKTFDTSLQAVYEKDIEEVLADPKNVMKMDQFLKGTLKNRWVIPGEGTKDPIPWLEQLKRTDWYTED